MAAAPPKWIRCPKLPTVQSYGPKFRLSQSYYPCKGAGAKIQRSEIYSTEDEARAAADDFRLYVEGSMAAGGAKTQTAEPDREARVNADVHTRLSKGTDVAAPSSLAPSSRDPPPSKKHTPPALTSGGIGTRWGGGGGGGDADRQAGSRDPYHCRRRHGPLDRP
jgi:hypothetical protein